MHCGMEFVCPATGGAETMVIVGGAEVDDAGVDGCCTSVCTSAGALAGTSGCVVPCAVPCAWTVLQQQKQKANSRIPADAYWIARAGRCFRVQFPSSRRFCNTNSHRFSLETLLYAIGNCLYF